MNRILNAILLFYQIKDELQTTIKDKMNQQYGVNDDVTESIDKLQQEVGGNQSPRLNIPKLKGSTGTYIHILCDCFFNTRGIEW